MIEIDVRSRVPIYEQLQANIRLLILQGTLKKDEKLPSVRELSSMLTINPNTIQKAYKALERDGFIYSVSGRGNFVRKLDEVIMKKEVALVLTKIDKLVQEAIDLKVPMEVVEKRVQTTYEEGES